MISSAKRRSVLSTNFNFPAHGRFTLWAVAAILLLTLLVYSNSISNDFTNWDDNELVVENPQIRSLDLDGIITIFTPKAGKTYQPVRVLSHAIDYRFWQLNPVGYHLGNIILHGLSAVVLYLLLASILGHICETISMESNRIIALFAALLFVVHPVNVEAVTWISSRKYGLLGLFYFSAFYFYVKSSEKRRHYKIHYAASISSYVVAILSSPFSITLPAMLLLYDFCRNRDNNLFQVIKPKLRSYLPYLLLAVCQLVLFWISFSTTSGPTPTIKGHHLNNPFYTFLTMSRVMYQYMVNLICPLWLNNMYVDHTSTSIFEYKVMILLIAVLFLLVIIILQARMGNKFSLFCFGWFVVTWLPVSNIIPISTKMADRYLYLPAVGLFLFFSASLVKLSQAGVSKNVRRPIVYSLVVFLICTLAYLSIKRNRVWANSETLWSDSLRKAPDYWVPYLNMGLVKAQQGNLDQAVDYYYKALQLSANSVHIHNNLGVALLEQGKIDEAVNHYMAALSLESDFAETYNNLGVALFRLGKFDRATEYYREALRLDPEFGKAHNNLGNVLVEQSKFEEAIFHYNKALATKAHYPEAHNNLGVALARQGRLNEAIIHFQEALRLKPDYDQARANLELTLAMAGRLPANSGSRPMK
jgi:tetratricopeptide (TPR) repeat protein